jgi:hypothetical protein
MHVTPLHGAGEPAPSRPGPRSGLRPRPNHPQRRALGRRGAYLLFRSFGGRPESGLIECELSADPHSQSRTIGELSPRPGLS